MLVSDVMKTKIVTITPEESIRQAMMLLLKHRFRHLPVINDEGKLVGIISDRDLRTALPAKIHMDDEDVEVLNTPVHTIMTTDVVSCHPRDFIDDVAMIFSQKKISCLPVIQGGELIGIITETDILHTLVQLMGVHQPSSKIIVEVPDQSGVLADIALIFKATQTNVASVLVYPDRTTGEKLLDFRVQTIDPRKAISAIEQQGYKVIWPTDIGEADGT